VRPLLVVLAFGTVGCATTSALTGPPPLLEPDEWVSWPVAARPVEAAQPRSRLASKAASLVGLSTLRVVVPQLPDDCTGLVRAVYEDSGIELMGSGVRGDNGVTAIHRLAFERSALHTQSPSPGDLVFFRETYDRNRDGQHNDGLTHVGVVESVDAAGTVTFVHRSGSGVTRAKLNVAAPLDKKRNDYLRPAKKGEPALLTGELFVTYASAVRLAGALSRRR
jgi:hypothetical protein